MFTSFPCDVKYENFYHENYVEKQVDEHSNNDIFENKNPSEIFDQENPTTAFAVVGCYAKHSTNRVMEDGVKYTGNTFRRIILYGNCKHVLRVNKLAYYNLNKLKHLQAL